MHLVTPSDSNNCLYRPESPSATNGSDPESRLFSPDSSLRLIFLPSCGQARAPESLSNRRKHKPGCAVAASDRRSWRRGVRRLATVKISVEVSEMRNSDGDWSARGTRPHPPRGNTGPSAMANWANSRTFRSH